MKFQMKKNLLEIGNYLKLVFIGNSPKGAGGQSLLEVVIALGVIVIVTGAFVVLATVSVRNSNFSKNQVTATQLGTEAIEAMITIRDQNTAGAIENNGDNNQWSKVAGSSLNVTSCPANPAQPCSGDFKLTNCTINSIPQRCITKTTTPELLNNGVFSRKVQITDAETNLKNVTVLVWWTDSQGLHKSVLIRKLGKSALQ